MFDLIAFDADDTLWQNETLYASTQERLKQLLETYICGERVEDRLLATETRNLAHFGYGVKAFTLSMIETAIEMTEGDIRAGDIQQIIDWGRAMLAVEIELLQHAGETVARLAETYQLMLLTKGDLLDQQNKLARSGLAGYFKYVEVVSEKTEDSYRRLLARYGIEPGRFLMIGNSLKSDILPVVAIGGQAVHIPFHQTWALEQVAAAPQNGYYELEHLGLLPELLEQLAVRGQRSAVSR